MEREREIEDEKGLKDMEKFQIELGMLLFLCEIMEIFYGSSF